MSKALLVQRLQAGETIRGHSERGNSMTPRIKSGQPVDITPVNRDLRTGDIVFAKVKGRFFLHLISALDGDRVQISNNHGHVNGWTHKSKVYGLVTPTDSER